ncbi:MAG: hypothetical protein KF709_12990 [Gemmatimonadaceae bacterium]|nr:hypothetical protein [Gemmatimonadaceae bacterium]
MSTKAAQASHLLRLRLRVVGPPANVSWAVQLGRSELLAPVKRGKDHIEFDIPLELVSAAGGELKVRGQAVQGPRGGRFLYVTSGKRAGDVMSPWDRRAKVSLETLPLDTIRKRPLGTVIALEGEIDGTAKDGGPACASIPLLSKAWTVAASTR